ncbi:COG0720 6-pyruvoyl-tetrahydropterin synthase [uncultured Caudovirales phage]|uniref:COG0720 6-pyruvoyl-tetrahydropterin synthase n=1 Tax=uncultured Caudovirales phage TaxID=2100421 RepID=A0A6J5RLR1_9CAUD|nr:COG0720 6-pyruvoyl-tetrahydropterin synthase [uncultured Caudovirales phage]CAB4198440.1 COG0720 6-pyruvoyl-tetrahydropterin synthase [uncultured Caudovirales phage]
MSTRFATVSKEIEFDAGHRVTFHDSKCRHPHGHRYRVRVLVSGAVIDDSLEASDSGMVIDFSDIKRLLTERVHDVYDHAFIVWNRDLLMLKAFAPLIEKDFRIVIVDFIPTAENLAASIFDDLDITFESLGLTLDRVDVFETPTSVASVSA